jgi:pyrophosphatase PpaX
MKRYQHFLFDWDGSLAQSLDIWLNCLKAELVQHGHQFSDKEIGADFGAFIERMKHKNINDIVMIVDQANRASEKLLPEVPLYPDVLHILESLKHADKKVALVTTSERARIDISLEKHGLKHLFDAIICADDVTNIKPHPEPLEKALSLLGADKKLSVMIGDSEKDIQAATNAGIDSILFHPERHKLFYDLEALKSYNPTYIVSNFKDILGLYETKCRAYSHEECRKT